MEINNHKPYSRCRIWRGRHNVKFNPRWRRPSCQYFGFWSSCAATALHISKKNITTKEKHCYMYIITYSIFYLFNPSLHPEILPWRIKLSGVRQTNIINKGAGFGHCRKEIVKEEKWVDTCRPEIKSLASGYKIGRSYSLQSVVSLRINMLRVLGTWFYDKKHEENFYFFLRKKSTFFCQNSRCNKQTT